MTQTPPQPPLIPMLLALFMIFKPLTVANLIGNLFSGLETSSARAQFYGLEEALGKKLKTPQVQADEIQKVTSADIKRLAQSIFKRGKANIALVGPFTKKDESKLIKLLTL